MAKLSKSGDATQAHRHAIEHLAAEMQCDQELVADVYWSELDRLERAASVKDFVPVLAARRTRDRLQRTRGRH